MLSIKPGVYWLCFGKSHPPHLSWCPSHYHPLCYHRWEWDRKESRGQAPLKRQFYGWTRTAQSPHRTTAEEGCSGQAAGDGVAAVLGLSGRDEERPHFCISAFPGRPRAGACPEGKEQPLERGRMEATEQMIPPSSALAGGMLHLGTLQRAKGSQPRRFWAPLPLRESRRKKHSVLPWEMSLEKHLSGLQIYVCPHPTPAPAPSLAPQSLALGPAQGGHRKWSQLQQEARAGTQVTGPGIATTHGPRVAERAPEGSPRKGGSDRQTG